MFHRTRSLRSPLVSIIFLAFAGAAAPANACGIFLPREGDARVAQERALIRWDGQTEDLVMEMSVEGRSTEAAWIVPLPARATVKLADAKLFDVLQEMTRPLIQVEVGATAAGGEAPAGTTGSTDGAVSVLERQSLGPFEVSTLAAQDAVALQDWLGTNGYRLPDGLSPLLDEYVAKRWYYLAVRLVPDQAGAGLTGKLDPLWVSFPADEIIYPMRLFALARGMLPVFLYVLADHRVALPTWADDGGDATAAGMFSTPFAEWVEPQSFPDWSAVAPFIERKRFLTKFDIYFENPGAIKSDFIFPLAHRDDTSRDVQVQYVSADDPRAAEAVGRPGTTADSGVWTLVGLAVLALAGVLLVWCARVARRLLS